MTPDASSTHTSASQFTARLMLTQNFTEALGLLGTEASQLRCSGEVEHVSRKSGCCKESAMFSFPKGKLHFHLQLVRLIKGHGAEGCNVRRDRTLPTASRREEDKGWLTVFWGYGQSGALLPS